MSIKREYPDSHVVSLANQFCDAATFLHREKKTSGPQATKVNAAFAIELYIKSLACRWVHHKDSEIEGIALGVVTSQSDLRGHELDELFKKLDTSTRDYLTKQFASHELKAKYGDLLSILCTFSVKFIRERYIFEHVEPVKPGELSDIVELALFFKAAVNSIERRRLG